MPNGLHAMPFVECRLGDLEYVHNNQNLKLKSSGLIKFSSAHFLHSISSDTPDLEAMLSLKTWTDGGSRVRLELQLIFDDVVIQDISQENFIESVGMMLCTAEVLLYDAT